MVGRLQEGARGQAEGGWMRWQEGAGRGAKGAGQPSQLTWTKREQPRQKKGQG